MSSPEPKPLEVVEEAKAETSGEGRGGGLRKMFWVAAFAIILLAIAALGTTGYLGQREMRGRVDSLQSDLETTRSALASAEGALAGERARADGLQSTLGRVNELSQQLAASLGELQALTSGAEAPPEAAGEEAIESEAIPDDGGEIDAEATGDPQAAAPESAAIEIETLGDVAPESGAALEDVLEEIPETAARPADSPTNVVDALEESDAPAPAISAESPEVDVEIVAPELGIEVTETLSDPILLPDPAPSILDGDNPLESSGALETGLPLEGELPLEAGELLGVREAQDANPSAIDEIPTLGAAPPVSEAPVEQTPPLWNRVVDGIRGLAPSD